MGRKLGWTGRRAISTDYTVSCKGAGLGVILPDGKKSSFRQPQFLSFDGTAGDGFRYAFSQVCRASNRSMSSLALKNGMCGASDERQIVD